MDVMLGVSIKYFPQSLHEVLWVKLGKYVPINMGSDLSVQSVEFKKIR